MNGLGVEDYRMILDAFARVTDALSSIHKDLQQLIKLQEDTTKILTRIAQK